MAHPTGTREVSIGWSEPLKFGIPDSDWDWHVGEVAGEEDLMKMPSDIEIIVQRGREIVDFFRRQAQETEVNHPAQSAARARKFQEFLWNGEDYS